MTVTWKIEIDWEGSGTYTDEGSRLLALSSSRGSDSSINADNLEHIKVGELSFVLENHDRRYDPYNTSSPLYGYILPARRLKVSVTTEGNQYTIFTGSVSDIRLQQQRSQAAFTAYDDMILLESQKSSNIDIETDYSVTDAITTLLTLAGWENLDTSGWIFPAELGVDSYLGSAAIEDNGDTIPYWWGDPDKTILESLFELSDDFAGNIFIAADGTFSYNARNYSQPSVYTLTQAELLQDIELQQPWDEIRNSIRVTGGQRTPTSLMDIWQLGDTPMIPPGETITIWAEYEYNDDPTPAITVTTPVATTDYTANIDSGGSGLSITAYMDVTFTPYATEAKIEITNTYSYNMYVTLFKIRGTLAAETSKIISVSENTASITAYGKRSLKIETRWIQDTQDIINRAKYAEVMHSSSKKIVLVRIVGRDSLQYNFDLYDYIDLEISAMDISGQYSITAIQHNYSAGSYCTTTYRLEPTAKELGSFWTFSAALGESSVLGW